MKKETPNYYAIIPAEVRYSSVNPNAKLLYGELTALSNKEGYCWASNDYFAKLYGVNKGTISEWVKQLAEAGFITYTISNHNERKVFIGGVSGKAEGGIRKNNRGVSGKAEHNNTSINNKNTGETEVSQEEIRVVPDTEGEEKPKKIKSTCYQVFDVFKEVLGRAPLNWHKNKTQRTCAENLFKERGLEQIRKALEFYRQSKDEPFCPVVDSPYDLDSKWTKLIAFRDK